MKKLLTLFLALVVSTAAQAMDIVQLSNDGINTRWTNALIEAFPDSNVRRFESCRSASKYINSTTEPFVFVTMEDFLVPESYCKIDTERLSFTYDIGSYSFFVCGRPNEEYPYEGARLGYFTTPITDRFVEDMSNTLGVVGVKFASGDAMRRAVITGDTDYVLAFTESVFASNPYFHCFATEAPAEIARTKFNGLNTFELSKYYGVKISIQGNNLLPATEDRLRTISTSLYNQYKAELDYVHQ